MNIPTYCVCVSIACELIHAVVTRFTIMLLNKLEGIYRTWLEHSGRVQHLEPVRSLVNSLGVYESHYICSLPIRTPVSCSALIYKPVWGVMSPEVCSLG